MITEKIQKAKKVLMAHKKTSDPLHNEWQKFSDYIISGLSSIEEKPVTEIIENRKFKGLVIYDHYKIECDTDNTLKLSINFNKHPQESDFTICDLSSERNSAIPIKHQLVDRFTKKAGSVRHPNQKWLFDLQVYDNAYGHYWAYSEEPKFMPIVVNYYALGFYIKVSAYFGLLDKLDHEVLSKLGHLSSNFTVDIENIESNCEKEEMTNFLLAVKRIASSDTNLKGLINFKKFADENNWDFIKELDLTDKKIKKALKKVCREKEVLSYLDTVLGGSFITDYMQATVNLKKYQEGLKRLRKESPILVDYIFAFEQDLKGLSDPSHFSSKNKVTDWDSFYEEFTFPQPLSLKNFKSFPNFYCYTQKHFMLTIGGLVNYELLEGIALTVPQIEKLKPKNCLDYNINSNYRRKLENRWSFLVSWVTHGNVWQSCSDSDLFVFNEWVTKLEDFDICGIGFDSSEVSVGFARLTDLLILYIQESKEKEKSEYKKNKELFEKGEISKKERTQRNESNIFYDFVIIDQLLDFAKGSSEINGFLESNLYLIKPSTTLKSLIRKSAKWHSDQVLLSIKEKEKHSNTDPYKHLNKTCIEIEGVKFHVLTSAYDIHKEGAEMHHCIGSYTGVIEQKLYLAFAGSTGNSRFTLGVSVTPLTTDAESKQTFKFHQCVGFLNSIVEQDILDITSKFISTINKDPSLVFNTPSSIQ